MTHLDILIPNALPPAEFSSDLRKQLNVPSLGTLTTRARADSSAASRETFDAYSRALPHEHWIARQFGIETLLQNSSSPPIATSLLRAFGHEPEDGFWFVLQPVHIHFARDHLVLNDPRRLPLEDEQSRKLFDVARPLFEEYGRQLIYGDAATWFVRADEWAELQTATPDAASGHNIDLWMPRGPSERDWRKLQNEVQMHWFSHPVNESREANGLETVNSLWLWGGAHTTNRADGPYDAAFNLDGWTRALIPLAAQQQSTPAPIWGPEAELDTATPVSILDAHLPRILLVLDDLLEPGLTGDWGRWLENIHAIEQKWLAPLLDGLRHGSLDELSLIVTGDVRLSRFTTTRSSLRKFWIKPSLDALMP